VVVREHLRGYRLNGRVARASRVVIGEYRDGVVTHTIAADDLVGADEVAAASASPTTADPAADTMPLDDATLRDIFGDPDEGGEA
jgi:hypothetical protein